MPSITQSLSSILSVSNSDGSISINPTTGVVVVSLNVGHANTWSALQTFNSGINSVAGGNTTVISGNSTTFTITPPSFNSAMSLDATSHETHFNNGNVRLIGSVAQVTSLAGGSSGNTPDVWWTRTAAATWQMGQADAASPIAQTLNVQSVAAGTLNTAGQVFTLRGSAATGNATSTGFAFATSDVGSSGTTRQSFSNKMTLDGAGILTLPNNVAKLKNIWITGGLSTRVIDIYSYAPLISIASGIPIVWESTSTITGSPQTGISQTAAATLAVGNGTQGNASGSLCMGNATSSTAPSLSFGATTSGGNGFGLGTNGDLNWFVNGTPRLSVTAQGLQLWNTTGNLGLAFASGTYGTSVDASLQRTAANTLAVGNGTAGDASGTVVAAKFSIAGGSSSMFNGGGYLAFQSPANGLAWTSSVGVNPQVNGLLASDNSANVRLISTGTFGWNTSTGNPTSSGTVQAVWSSPTSGSIQQGGPDATAPVAQTYRFQSVANTATANTAAPNATIILPLSLGNASTGASLIIQGGAVAASGTTQQTATTIFTLTQIGNLTLAGGITAAAASFTTLGVSSGTSTFNQIGIASNAIVVGSKITTYNSIATAGIGVVATYAAANITAQSAATTITSYVTPAADGDYEVSASMNVTAATAISTSLNVTYTDVGGNAQTLILPVQKAGGTGGTNLVNGLVITTGDFSTDVRKIRVKASTTITILTATGTFNTVTYSASGNIKQTA